LSLVALLAFERAAFEAATGKTMIPEPECSAPACRGGVWRGSGGLESRGTARGL